MSHHMTPEQLRTIVCDTLAAIAPDVEPARLAHDVPLREQVDIDADAWRNFHVALHERFNVDIPESDNPQLGTVDQIVAYLRARLTPRL